MLINVEHVKYVGYNVEITFYYMALFVIGRKVIGRIDRKDCTQFQ